MYYVFEIMHCYFLDESDETKAFLTLLSTWDKQELEQKLGQRVEFSKRAIGKLLQAFDRLLQRNEKLNKGIQEKVNQEVEELDLSGGGIKKEPGDVKTEVEEKKEAEEESGEKSIKTEEDTESTTEAEEKKEGKDPV
jgi:E3 ubiquitin-protein ligase BRE1